MPRSPTEFPWTNSIYSDSLFLHIHQCWWQKLPFALRHCWVKNTAPRLKTDASCNLAEPYHIQALQKRYWAIVCNKLWLPIWHIKWGGQVTFTPWHNSITLLTRRAELIIGGIYKPVDSFIDRKLLPYDRLDDPIIDKIEDVREQTQWKSCIILESWLGIKGKLGYNIFHLKPLRMMRWWTDDEKTRYYSLVLKRREEFTRELNALEFYAIRRGKITAIDKPNFSNSSSPLSSPE